MYGDFDGLNVAPYSPGTHKCNSRQNIDKEMPLGVKIERTAWAVPCCQPKKERVVI